MYSNSWWIVPANDRMRIGNSPGECRRRSPITITCEKTTDATNRMPYRNSGRYRIHNFQPLESIVTDTESDTDYSTDQAAVPDKSSTSQNKRKRIGKKLTPLIYNKQQACP